MTECKYSPLFGRVIIKREVEEKRGSIFIPTTAQMRHARAEGSVIAKGPNAEGVEIGDKVIFGKHSGTWLDQTYSQKAENDDGTMFLCQDEDILAVIRS